MSEIAASFFLLYNAAVWAALAVEKAITNTIYKITHNKEFEGAPKSGKQAFLVDNAHSQDWDMVFGVPVFLILGTFMMHLLPEINLQGLASIYSTLVFMTASMIDIRNFRIMARTLKLEKALKTQDYSVSVYHKLDGNMDSFIGRMDRTACHDGTTVFLYSGHGYKIKKDGMLSVLGTYEEALKRASSYEGFFWPGIKDRLAPSFLNREDISDAELVYKVSAIPGNKVVVINACESGGFADAASFLPGSKSKSLALITSYDRRVGQVFNKLVPSFTKFVKGNSTQRVSEFFQAHADVHQKGRWNQIRRHIPLAYCPKAFAGSSRIRI